MKQSNIWVLSIISLFFSGWISATDNFAGAKHQDQFPAYPQVNYQPYSPEQADEIKRGEYLVKIGDCVACHTRPKGVALAGGLPIKTPFGIIYTPNLTPDRLTGIGTWSEADFIRAMRQGRSQSGHYYYPAFPYPYFNRITTDDLKAMKAYLDAIPAIRQANPANAMHFPFNWRFLQWGWRLLFFDNLGPYKYDPQQSEPWNRGKYLVDSLGHCSMCHTPMYHFISKEWVLAAPIKRYYLTGGMIEGFFAPNITATNLANTTVQDLADVFLKDKLIGGGKVEGPMKEVNHDSLKYLTPSDINAISVYLHTVKSEVPPKHHVGDATEAGRDTYEQYCSSCHSTGAGGAPKIEDVQAWEPLIKQGLNTLYKNAINGIGGMPAKGTCTACTTQEIQTAVRFIVHHSQPGAADQMKSPKGQPIKKLTLTEGKQIYEQHCAFCHDGSNPEAPKLGDRKGWDPLVQQGFDLLFFNTIRGLNNMPARGGCGRCNDAHIKAALQYMLYQSHPEKDYRLW